MRVNLASVRKASTPALPFFSSVNIRLIIVMKNSTPLCEHEAWGMGS